MNTCTQNNKTKPLIYRISKRIFCQNCEVIVWRVRMQLRWTDLYLWLTKKLKFYQTNAPVIWNPRTPPPRGWPGHLNSPLPGAKVNVELLRPHMTHTHTPVIAKRNKGWQIIMIVGKNTWISVLLSQHLQTLAEEGKWRLDLKTLQLEFTKCEIKKYSLLEFF